MKDYKEMSVQELGAELEYCEKYKIQPPQELLDALPSTVGTITLRVNVNSPVFEGNRILGTVVRIESPVTTSNGELQKDIVMEHNPFKDYHANIMCKTFPTFAKKKGEKVGSQKYMGRINGSYHVTYDLLEIPTLANRMSSTSESELQIMASVGREIKVTGAMATAAELPKFSSVEEQIAFLKSAGSAQRKENTANLLAWSEAQKATFDEVDADNPMGTSDLEQEVPM